jgi:hypothetical protein
MLCLDVTHIVWRNCPTALRGQFMRGDHQYPTIMLEAVASNDLWIWHAFFGPAGSLNDVNVLNQSPLFLTARNGTAPKCPFNIGDRQYKRGYYLCDRIYPNWSVFVKTFSFPADQREKRWAKQQESARKDVERAFGVLKAKWGIINRPVRSFGQGKIKNIVYACIILHNMILKDEGHAISPVYIRDPPVQPQLDETVLPELRDDQMHFRLKYDLADHINAQDLPHLDLKDN